MSEQQLPESFFDADDDDFYAEIRTAVSGDVRESHLATINVRRTRRTRRLAFAMSPLLAAAVAAVVWSAWPRDVASPAAPGIPSVAAMEVAPTVSVECVDGATSRIVILRGFAEGETPLTACWSAIDPNNGVVMGLVAKRGIACSDSRGAIIAYRKAIACPPGWVEWRQ